MTGRASAPASAANLGPGFDVIALALDLRCRVVAAPEKEWRIESPGLDDHAGAFRRAHQMAETLDCDGAWGLSVSSEIPLASGLGSSAAYTLAAGAAMLAAAGREIDRGVLVEAAAEVEGHADNVAASAHGGLVAVHPDGSWYRLHLSETLRVLVATPKHRLSTEAARQALPTSIDRGIASRTVARAILLVEALRTGEPQSAATRGDELHEAPRSGLSPATTELVGAAFDAGALHAAWSGAGPSAIAFVTPDTLGRVETAWRKFLDGGGSVREISPDMRGLSVG